MTDLEYLHYDDLMSDLASAISKYGVRKVLADFSHNYPAHYNELLQHIVLQQTKQKVPALLMKRDAPSM